MLAENARKECEKYSVPPAFLFRALRGEIFFSYLTTEYTEYEKNEDTEKRIETYILLPIGVSKM
jgi:hypothetical protein